MRLAISISIVSLIVLHIQYERKIPKAKTLGLILFNIRQNHTIVAVVNIQHLCNNG